MIALELHRRFYNADPHKLHLRAYAEPVAKPVGKAGGGHGGRQPRTAGRVEASEWSLIFDTETTICPAQRLRFGIYQLREGDRLDEEGVFYDADALGTAEVDCLHAWASARGLGTPMSLADFREGVFLAKGYAAGATIIGLNLPFDLSRIAIRGAPARVTRFRQKMRGGFTLVMSERPDRPNVQVKHLSPRASLIEFSSPGTTATARSRRKRSEYTPVHRGAFLDVKTAAATLTSASHSLASLTATLGTPTRKLKSNDHGRELSEAYLDYARSDVQATWECACELLRRYAAYGLSEPLHRLVSEAGLGKAMLREMGVRTWREVQPGYDPHAISRIQSTYFGGRTEVRIRRSPVRVLHTDFTSMYPTVCRLQRLWPFMIAEGFSERDATADVRAFVERVTPAEMRDQSAWPELAAIVRIRPDRDLQPVRTTYENELHATIGLNQLSAGFDVWITLADCIAAKFLSGKTPEVLEAFAFEPLAPQAGLTPMRLFGEIDFDPYVDDLFKVAICRREELKLEAKLAPLREVAIEEKRQNLKILANSTSYGIYMQMNVQTVDASTAVRVFRPDGTSFITQSRKLEKPGPYFHPLIATLITGAARLLLALAEREAIDQGLGWAFCDTDSLALVQPDGMNEADFLQRADAVVVSFKTLNPYGSSDSILKVEDVNFDEGVPKPLYCYAVSSKRYALYNLDAQGSPVIRKASAHGLGHFLAPYPDGTPVRGIPEPRADLQEGKDRVSQWEHDLWFQIIRSALGNRLKVSVDWHPALGDPSASRYGASGPEMLRWLAVWNEGKAYCAQVKPFGFMLSFHARRLPRHSDFRALRKEIRISAAAPIAPFTADPGTAVPFDRVTGELVPVGDLQTYAEALALFPFKPESKFKRAGAFDDGLTERRHVVAIGVQLIGKEAEHSEEPELLTAGEALAIQYDEPSGASARLAHRLKAAAERMGDAHVARETGLPRAAIARLRNSARTPSSRSELNLKASLHRLVRQARRQELQARSRLVKLELAITAAGGLRAAARSLGVDASNLSKAVR